MTSSSGVEKSIETDDRDIFDDVFGEDEEKKVARIRMTQKAEALKRQKEKIELNDEQTFKDQFNKSDKDNENEINPEDVFQINNDESDDFETKEEAFEVAEAGDKISKRNSEFEEREKIEKSIENSKKGKKSYGGKLDLKVVHDDEKEEKAHPIERKIIKSVIKNKALLFAENEIKINKGTKISDNSLQRKSNEQNHDEIAEDLMREEGIKEEGIMNEEETVKAEDKTKKGLEINFDSDDSSIKPPLEFLMSAPNRAFIGRKKSVMLKYGEEAGLFIGKVNERDKNETEILLDGLNPHVIFVCGARGSGKSYVLGVIAEELALKNDKVGIIVVDPIGVFWSMKHPNKEEKELEALAKWGLLPRGLDNIKVFIPIGMKESVPKSTYDAVFSIQPAMLTAEDWCLTFGIDRFSPTGLLLEKGITKVKQGYTTEDGKEIRGKANTFSLDDLIKCFENDAELNNREKGYKADSIRALVSRFDAAKNWGVFDNTGTSLGVLSRAGQMTILDTSFLEDNVSALVIGILSRRILSSRKLSTRREAAGKFSEDTDIEELSELNIPPTWLFIDEAHTLIPGGNQKTPASNALVEYVKQGRRPGCSLVFATQQPSAIDSKVLSQLDIIMAHKLVFDDDIKSIYKRTPAIVPGAYRKPNFIKTMPTGIALVGDRSETTSRAFIMSIRPRMSQHEGRDAETIESNQELDVEQVELLAVNIILRQLAKDPLIRIESIKETIDNLNNTYKKSLSLESVLEAIEKKGIKLNNEAVFAPGVFEEMEAEKEIEKKEHSTIPKELKKTENISRKNLPEEVEQFEEQLNEIEEKVELIALKQEINESEARKKLFSYSQKKLGLFPSEILDRLSLKHAPIYKIKYKYFNHKDAFHVGEAYINSLTGEFIHDDNGKLRESKGLPILIDLSEAETNALKLIAYKKRTPDELAKKLNMEEGNAKRILDALVKKGFLSRETNQKGVISHYQKNKVEIELPPSPLHEILPSIGKRPITEIDSATVLPPKLSEKEIPDLLKKLWGNIVVKEITQIFLPVWEGTLKKKTGEERKIIIDAIKGKKMIEF